MITLGVSSVNNKKHLKMFYTDVPATTRLKYTRLFKNIKLASVWLSHLKFFRNHRDMRISGRCTAGLDIFFRFRNMISEGYISSTLANFTNLGQKSSRLIHVQMRTFYVSKML